MSTKLGTPRAAARNACKLCAPLGASLAFRGVEGAIPLLHGSQGCATYIRRYMIGHFREPMDVASSSFSESAAVFGGMANLHAGLENVIRQYQPKLIGVATTCLSETIGDDVSMMLHEFDRRFDGADKPRIVPVSTPSYSGTHAEGFHATVRALVDHLAVAPPPAGRPERRHINVLPGMLTPAELRHLKELVAAYGLTCTLLPDYSETLDAGTWEDYERIPKGGTPVADIEQMAAAEVTIELGAMAQKSGSAGELLLRRFGVRLAPQELPIGIEASDQLCRALEAVSGRPTPHAILQERSRLADAYIDGHRYVFGKRAVVYGDPDLVVALTRFLAEIGVEPVLCASGDNHGHLAERILSVVGSEQHIETAEGIDFVDIEERVAKLAPHLLIGNSKGYKISRKLNVPLVRVGFPIHDRFGAARLMSVGYSGTQRLFDRVVNALIQQQQSASSVGYSYI